MNSLCYIFVYVNIDYLTRTIDSKTRGAGIGRPGGRRLVDETVAGFDFLIYGNKKKQKQNKQKTARLVSLSSLYCTFINFWFIWKLTWLLNLA